MPFLLLATAAQAATDSAEQEAELKALQQRIETLKGVVDRTRASHSDSQNQLRATELKIGTLQRGIRELDHQIDQRRKRLAGLEDERGALRASLKQHRQALKQQVRASYAMGRQEQLKMLLNQEDPSTLGRMMVYYDYFNRARARLIERVKTDLERLNQVETSIVREQDALARDREQKSTDRKRLDAERDKRAAVVARLKRELNSKDKELSQLRANAARLQQLIDSLQNVIGQGSHESTAEQRPFAELKGKLPWPVQGPLTQRFGRQREIANLRWQGVMIQAGEGQTVKTISHGQIVFADWLRGFGLLIIVDHGDGYMSLYGHNQSLFKEAGDWVEPGEQIATVGNTGGRETTGLYFEIRRNGKPVNPRRWCAGTPGPVLGMN